MSHCRSPATCSVCRGEPARKVELAGGVVLVDGVPVERPTEIGVTAQMANSSKRGGRRTGQQRRRTR